MNILSILISTILFTACSTVQLQSSFNAKEVNWAKEKGTLSISGQGFARTQGGDVKLCSGSEVSLIPKSKYATERINHIYGNDTKGRVGNGFNFKKLPEAPKEYGENMTTTTCDAQGNFKFQNLPSGEYYLVLSIGWITPYNSHQRALMMEKVNLKSESIKSLILSM